jgi:hypothetical protein
VELQPSLGWSFFFFFISTKVAVEEGDVFVKGLGVCGDDGCVDVDGGGRDGEEGEGYWGELVCGWWA